MADGIALYCHPHKLAPFAPPSVSAEATPGQVRRTTWRTEAGSALPLWEVVCGVSVVAFTRQPSMIRIEARSTVLIISPLLHRLAFPATPSESQYPPG
jgi:hypothetical protein